MKALRLVPAFLLFSSVMAGCHTSNTDAAKCPAGINTTSIPNKAEFQGVPYAEDGAVCLTQTPVTGFPFLGLYQYDDSGTPSAPNVFLDGPENSTFAAHGVSDRKIKWGVMINDKGHLVGQTGPGGAIVYLFFNYQAEGHHVCTPGLICDPQDMTTVNTDRDVWQAAQLSLSFDRKEMRVFGERILKCADWQMDPQNLGPCAEVEDDAMNVIDWPAK
jgi:hypothetical protein